MRALCGAIITAGALIGLGLAAMGFGARYHTDPSSRMTVIHFDDVDRPLAFIIVFISCVAFIGLGIAFVGLAYHQKRREHEMAVENERQAARQRTTV